MKRYALLVVLMVLGLSTVSWGSLIGLDYISPCVGMGQMPCWNPCLPRPCPPPPCPEPEPTPYPPPCPTPNPCPPSPCPPPCPIIGGGLCFRVGVNISAYNFGGCMPCFPGSPGEYPQQP